MNPNSAPANNSCDKCVDLDDYYTEREYEAYEYWRQSQDTASKETPTDEYAEYLAFREDYYDWSDYDLEYDDSDYDEWVPQPPRIPSLQEQLLRPRGRTAS